MAKKKYFKNIREIFTNNLYKKDSVKQYILRNYNKFNYLHHYICMTTQILCVPICVYYLHISSYLFFFFFFVFEEIIFSIMQFLFYLQ